jgi:hypothetical protein
MDDNKIWSVYERNSLFYSKCKDLKTCPNNDNNKCYCHNYALVHPTVIAVCGFCDTKPSINKKCYIKFGDLCSICIEPILTKSSAWLTPCSHVFHRKCLIRNFQYRTIHEMTISFSNEIPCPVCREGHVDCCVGLDTLGKYIHTENGLDRLENFWQTINLMSYISCYKCDQGLGMNKQCINCENYRKTGEY